ncbi:hypothetical protein [Micromonospora sp. WMMD975]|nr:hypothetical protein [Micromonospora sp. WMMD975]WFE35318.1 hypothetical protein O7613_08045 [Micromonospora sp. WMMD975]
MGDVIVIQFVTLDGVVSDPDGRGPAPHPVSSSVSAPIVDRGVR